SKDAYAAADLILMVFSANEPLTAEERELLDGLDGRPAVAIINKVDLPQQFAVKQLEAWLPKERIVEMSVVHNIGLEELEKVLVSIFFSGEVEASDFTYVSNARHIAELKKAKQSLQDAIAAIGMGIPIDVIQIDVRSAWEHLGEIIGDTVSDSLIDQIF